MKRYIYIDVILLLNMAQGKLGQQTGGLNSNNNNRITRKQRVQAKEKRRIEELEYNQYKTEAQRLQKEVFVDKPNDPFTLDEYTEEYQKLDPNIKQFLATPESIKVEQERKKEVQKTTISQRIKQTQGYISDYKKKIVDYQEWWKRKSPEYRDKESNQENYNKHIRSYELTIEEKQNTIINAQNNISKIEEGATASDIWNYAQEKAQYTRNRQETKIENRAIFNKQIKTGELDKNLELLQLASIKQAVTYKDYQNSIKQYNKNVEELKSIQSYSEKVGWNNLSDIQKQKLNPSAYSWQRQNPTEKLNFGDSGNVVSVQSGSLNKLLDISEYNRQANKTPDEYYKEYKSTQKDSPVYIDYNSSNIIYPYETKGTYNNLSSQTKFFPINISSNKGNKTSNNVFSTVWDNIKQGYSYITEKTPEIKVPLFMGGTGASIKLSSITTPISSYLGEETEKVYKKTIEKAPNKLEIDKQFEIEYQTRFEKEYSKDLIYGKIDFETASKEFTESNEGQIISKKYQDAITENTKKMNLGDKLIYGTKLGGLGLTKSIVDFMPKTYGEGVLKGALIYTGVKTLKTIPPIVNNIALGGFGSYGLYKTFSPTSTPTEAGAGLITSVITGASLGYAGYRYLKSPVITQMPSPKNSGTFKTFSVGEDLKILDGSKTLNKVIFKEQKLSQFTTAGKRVIVTTKWRALANKYISSWNNIGGKYNFGVADINFKSMPKFTKFSDIYSGNPYQEQAIYGYDTLRGTKYLIKESGYQKALNLLKDYGYNDYQATSTLRYTAPTIKEDWIKFGIIEPKGVNKAEAIFTFERRQPVIELGDGIKTRGARTIRDVQYIQRELISSKLSGNMIDLKTGSIINYNKLATVIEDKTSLSYLLEKGSTPPTIKSGGFSKTTSLVKSSDPFKTWEKVGGAEDFNIYKPSTNSKILSSISSTDKLKFSIKPSGTLYSEKTYKKVSGSIGLLEDKTISLQSPKPSFLGGESTTATTTSTTSLKDIIKNVAGGSTTATTTSTTTSTKQLLNSFLKQTAVPNFSTKTININKITQFKSSTISGVSSATAGVTATNLKSKQTSTLKSLLKQITGLKLNNLNVSALKQILKSKQISKQISKQTSKQTSAFAFNPASLNIKSSLPELTTPSPTTTSKTPTFPVVFFGDKQLKKRIKKKRKNKNLDALALLPDFTTRAIGLKPQEFKNVSDAMKEIKKLQTGFGIRRGGRIKGNKSIDEKQIMMKIIK